MKAMILSLLVVCVHMSAWSAEKAEGNTDKDISDILSNMGYPELQVVPRASERLKMEAKWENNYWWASHWPVTLSGAMTAWVGLTAGNDRRADLNAENTSSSKSVATVAQGIGFAWVAGGVLLGLQHPYGNGLKQVNKVSGKDERASLLRERLAEEALERPAKVMRVLEHISVITNVAANLAQLSYVDKEGKVKASIGALMGLLPYMFEDNAIAVQNKHIEYKKKIFTPIKSASLWVDPVTQKVTPMTSLVWVF
jgi:hypothetical protein